MSHSPAHSSQSPAPARTQRFIRTSAWAVPFNAVIAVLLILAGAGWFFLSRPSVEPTQVTVVDEAKVLDPIRLQEDLSELKTYKPTRVVVYVRNGDYRDNLNEQTLNWARDHPEMNLISPDGRKWADGVFIISVSVENNSGLGTGQVGTYFGEDIKVEPTDRQLKLQERGYDSFHAGDWEAGVLKIAEGASGVMARPFYAHLYVIIGAVAVALLFVLWNFLAVRSMRRTFDKANAAFEKTTSTVNDEVSQTEFIPDAGLGARVKKTAHWTLSEYTDALELRDQINAVSLFAINTWNRTLKRRIEKFSDTGQEISAAVATLRDANRLYGRSDDWESIWRKEVDDTSQHFNEVITSKQLPTLLKSADYSDERREEYLEQLREVQDFAKAKLGTFDELYQRGLDAAPEEMGQLLDELSLLRADLSRRMQALMELARPTVPEKAKFVDESVSKKMNRAAFKRTSITGYFDRGLFYTPTIIATGYVAGINNYREEQRRQEREASSGGSNTSYGSSGGGFSGSGSSSHF